MYVFCFLLYQSSRFYSEVALINFIVPNAALNRPGTVLSRANTVWYQINALSIFLREQLVRVERMEPLALGYVL